MGDAKVHRLKIGGLGDLSTRTFAMPRARIKSQAPGRSRRSGIFDAAFQHRRIHVLDAPDQVLDSAERSSESNIAPHEELDSLVPVPDSGDGLIMGSIDARPLQPGTRYSILVGSERQ